MTSIDLWFRNISLATVGITGCRGKSEIHETSQEAILDVQMNDDGGLNQWRQREMDKQKSKLLEVERIVITDGLNLQEKQKKKE